MVKRVAVIGAGASGLTAIKCCLDEGLEPTCFEKNDYIGGLWRYKDVPEDEGASIYKSVVVNSSKEMMSFSDFPAPDNFPNYMHNSKVMEYFQMYAEKFNLLKYIQNKTAVRSLQKADDFPITGQWIVTTEREGKQDTGVFDAVLICTGHHSFPYLPLSHFPGIEQFKGQYMHSREYKLPDNFRNKRVLVVGIGNSGGDIAVELSRTAEKVFLSTRRGAWVIQRVFENGYPVDITMLSRFQSLTSKLLPSSVTNYMMESSLNKRFNHCNYGLQAQHRFNAQHPTINDDLPNCIISGNVQIRPNVKAFTSTDAIFEDGTVEENIDVVIFATGYKIYFPFCDETLISVNNNQVILYKYMFPYHLEMYTLAVVGLIQPIGAIMPISELQCRLATRVFKGLVKLPKREDMAYDIAGKRFSIFNRYVDSQRHTIQVDYVEYMDELARFLGVKPDLLHLFKTDPKLGFQVLFGPCTSYQFRLTGPGKWSGARNAIMTQWNRIIMPTKTRTLKSPIQNSLLPRMLIVGVVLMILAIFVFHF